MIHSNLKSPKFSTPRGIILISRSYQCVIEQALVRTMQLTGSSMNKNRTGSNSSLISREKVRLSNVIRRVRIESQDSSHGSNPSSRHRSKSRGFIGSLSDEIFRVLLRVQQTTKMKVFGTYSTLKLSLRCPIIQSYLRKFGFSNPKKSVKLTQT